MWKCVLQRGGVYFAHVKPGSELSGDYPVNCVDFRNGTQSDPSGFKPANKQTTPLPKPSTESAVYADSVTHIMRGMRGLDPQLQASGVS